MNKVFLSVDGGGTKLNMVLFDENFQILGEGAGGGVNLNSTTEADAQANILDCLSQVFARRKPDMIERLYYIFVGRAPYFLEELKKICAVNEAVPIAEPIGGLLAGAMWKHGILALAGTGSDVFYIAKGKPLSNRQASLAERTVVGGWGPLLGDDGGGVWIGHQAVRRAIAGLEGWAEPTEILNLIRREWQLKHDWEMVSLVYQSPSPFRKVASLTRAVGEAAVLGDKVARAILTEAGKLLAVQAECLVRRFHIPPEDFRMVTCGGAWKAHPLFFDTFKDALAISCPGLYVRRHRFEHVMAGPAREMLNICPDNDTAETRLMELFPQYIVQWD